MSHTETAEDSDGEIFEDAHDSPLEQRISDSIVATKDNKENGIFSLVPSRVATFPSPSQPSSTSQTDAVCNPDSFSDLFRLLAPSKPADRREKLPFPRDRHSYSLWSLLKNFVGKDVTRIALPVHLNEPLSFTQRLVEDLEYYELAHKAAAASSVSKRLALLAALASSCWVTTLTRYGKPFNPMLGETYELVHQEGGFCVVSEQVSHHPPITALHVESDKWVFWEEYKLDIKFRGQWVKVLPTGLVHFMTKDDGYHYSWNKPHSTIHNVLFGTLWADHEGDVVVTCHTTGEKAVVHFVPYSKAKERYRELHGNVFDDKGEVQYILHGAWDKGMTRKSRDGTGVKEMWRANEQVPNWERQYGFTQFAMTLNEPEDTVTCPTDSRYRPDQRLLENGDVDEASDEKFRLEEKQRTARRLRESRKERWRPVWFDLVDDPDTKTSYYRFNGKYWDAKLRNCWDSSPDIF
jgi:hypothetical protein